MGGTLERVKCRLKHSESASCLEEIQKRVAWKPDFVIEGKDMGFHIREAGKPQCSQPKRYCRLEFTGLL